MAALAMAFTCGAGNGVHLQIIELWFVEGNWMWLVLSNATRLGRVVDIARFVNIAAAFLR